MSTKLDGRAAIVVLKSAMREVGIAFGLFVLLALGALGIELAAWTTLVYGGILLVGIGLVFSLPCAVRYHLLLYRALAPRGALDKRWLWNPTGHHARLTDEERRRVLPWFYAGAAGWVLSILGCVLAGVAVVGVGR